MAEKLRNMTAVYLFREGKLLMLYRVGSRVVAPSWCGVGGHFEHAIIDGLSIIAFGVSLIGMGGSVQQTRKNTNENNECKQKIDDMISSNNNVFDEIKNLNKKMNHMSSRINSINNEIKEKNSIFDFIIRIIKKTFSKL